MPHLEVDVMYSVEVQPNIHHQYVHFRNSVYEGVTPLIQTYAAQVEPPRPPCWCGVLMLECHLVHTVALLVHGTSTPASGTGSGSAVVVHDTISKVPPWYWEGADLFPSVQH